MPFRATKTTSASAAAVLLSSLSSPRTSCHGFAPGAPGRPPLSLCVFAPPGSGYVSCTDAAEEADDDDAFVSPSAPGLTASEIREVSPRALPSTYDPMLEYPGTMR